MNNNNTLRKRKFVFLYNNMNKYQYLVQILHAFKSGQTHFKSSCIYSKVVEYIKIQLVWPVHVLIWNVYLEEYSLQPHES